jgi:hypothetical protein
MTSTADDLVARLHEEQRRAWAEQEAREAAERAQYPDAQWNGPALYMPAADYDPTPQEQQAFADTYRAEHPNAGRFDQHGGTPLSEALYEWRQAEASRRYLVEADAFVAGPACDVCGATGAHESRHDRRPCRVRVPTLPSVRRGRMG